MAAPETRYGDLLGPRRKAAIQRLVRAADAVIRGEQLQPGVWRLRVGSVLALREARDGVCNEIREVRK